MEFKHKGWIGFDLDGCLATYDGWVGFSRIGDPVDKIVDLLVKYAEAGWEVRIFTGRVAPDPDSQDIPVEQRRVLIREWLTNFVVPKLPKDYPEVKITHEKDKFLFCIYDDRCRAVVPSLGIRYMDLLRKLTKTLTPVLSSRYETGSGTVLKPSTRQFNELLQVWREVSNLLAAVKIEDLPESK